MADTKLTFEELMPRTQEPNQLKETYGDANNSPSSTILAKDSLKRFGKLAGSKVWIALALAIAQAGVTALCVFREPYPAN